jgi:GDPmannose 4,6-dehydratase
MCNYVFNKLGLNYKDYVEQDSKFLRAEELDYLKGDSSKLRKTVGWEPHYTFEMLMDEMIEHWLNIYK